MEELNDEEMMGIEGGACKRKIAFNDIIKIKSNTFESEFLVGDGINQIVIKKIKKSGSGMNPYASENVDVLVWNGMSEKIKNSRGKVIGVVKWVRGYLSIRLNEEGRNEKISEITLEYNYNQRGHAAYDVQKSFKL